MRVSCGSVVVLGLALCCVLFVGVSGNDEAESVDEGGKQTFAPVETIKQEVAQIKEMTADEYKRLKSKLSSTEKKLETEASEKKAKVERKIATLKEQIAEAEKSLTAQGQNVEELNASYESSIAAQEKVRAEKEAKKAKKTLIAPQLTAVEEHLASLPVDQETGFPAVVAEKAKAGYVQVSETASDVEKYIAEKANKYKLKLERELYKLEFLKTKQEEGAKQA
eukprot:Nk52_evm83s223 gene=Nk52_evmTU83s223